ncbi:hypothetical protein PAPYR_13121 [Paratrimastix pyriformis]|uniref:Uncharacterized protein n=1 Tax=Paratrimastix pyriformis TaxID=342808 RepID=A0ABQ8U0S2_9EUKA|nr:hypothetical protein PAPYR_13121 [Paratrimastix pyriformis]
MPFLSSLPPSPFPKVLVLPHTISALPLLIAPSHSLSKVLVLTHTVSMPFSLIAPSPTLSKVLVLPHTISSLSSLPPSHSLSKPLTFQATHVHVLALHTQNEPIKRPPQGIPSPTGQ